MDHYKGDKTPLQMNTPYPYEGQGGFSTIGSKSPAAGGFSPSFATPLIEGPSFTPSHIYDVGLSPGPVQRTPIPNMGYSSGGQTPGGATPYYYNLQSFNVNQSPAPYRLGDVKNSGSRNRSSSSPSYSDIILSQSPSYTPLSSQNSSPSYGSRREPNQDNDSIKNQEDDENDEPED